MGLWGFAINPAARCVWRVTTRLSRTSGVKSFVIETQARKLRFEIYCRINWALRAVQNVLCTSFKLPVFDSESNFISWCTDGIPFTGILACLLVRFQRYRFNYLNQYADSTFVWYRTRVPASKAKATGIFSTSCNDTKNLSCFRIPVNFGFAELWN